jgi:hypothetical protein
MAFEGIADALRRGMHTRQDVWPVVAIVLFAVSLVMPAAQLDFGHTPLFGIHCLELGWCTVPWYANVALVLAVIARALAWHGVALAIGVLAIFIALSAVCYANAVELRAGFYIWLGSLIAFAIACARACVRT